jgi:tetratricopeptide (TPR) repeat protein
MGAASEAWREAVAGSTGERWQPEQWIDEGDVRKEATRAVGRGKRPGPARDRGPDRGPQPSRRRSEAEAATPVTGKGVGQARAARLEDRQKHAIEAFKRQRFDEARRLLKPLTEALPASELVRELHGLTLYRLGRWKQAAAELEAFRSLGGSTEQHPVLADCYRALGRHDEVEVLWDELREASPRADLVAEGRIVMAGSLADRGRLADAIALLGRAKLPTKRPQEHHLRVAYALADLYERASHHWHHHSSPTRIRSCGCQQ